MVPHPKIIQAVESLGYRVTTGDVASQAGLSLELAEKDLLLLAGETGGIFQVGDTGDIVYAFPNNVRAILRSKFFKLRLQEAAKKIWQVGFYLFRMSVGIVLILLIVLVVVAIVVTILAIMSSQKGSNNSSGNRRSGGGVPLNFFYFPNFFHLFSPNYGHHRYQTEHRTRKLNSSHSQSTATASAEKMGFLEAVFSFLFGDNIPNLDLEERRWRTIATVVRNHKGAVPAEVIAPYLDEVGEGDDYRAESYMMPVLAQFNGKPEFSPENDLVYHFPELQATASQQKPQPVPDYLQESLWKFSSAGAGQLWLAGGLGALLFGLSLVLGGLLFLGELESDFALLLWPVFWAGLGYSTVYLLTPLVRFFWLQWRNRLILARNDKRQNRALAIAKPGPRLQRKLAYAEQFAEETVISQDKLVYTTETDLISQEHDRLFGTDPT